MNTQATFFARVWLSEEDIDHIELWCQELVPTDVKHRSVEDWVREHLEGEDDRSRYIDMIHAANPDQPVDGCYQLLLKGVISGHYDYYGEYDEDVDFSECSWSVVPKEWFDKEASSVVSPAQTLDAAMKNEDC